MLDHQHSHDAIHVPALCASCAPMRAFVHDNRDALLNAAALLGGRRGAALVHAFLDSLSGAASPRRVRRDLHAVLDLLTLEHVHDPDRPEAGHFAALRPWDPVVEDICLLADGLSAWVAAWDAAHTRADTTPIDARQAA